MIVCAINQYSIKQLILQDISSVFNRPQIAFVFSNNCDRIKASTVQVGGSQGVALGEGVAEATAGSEPQASD